MKFPSFSFLGGTLEARNFFVTTKKLFSEFPEPSTCVFLKPARTSSQAAKRAIFVRSGNININLGRLRNSGLNGNWWSTSALTYTSSTDARSSNLNFNAADVNPSNNNNRWNGFSLRCLDFRPRFGADLLKFLPFFHKFASH